MTGFLNMLFEIALCIGLMAIGFAIGYGFYYLIEFIKEYKNGRG